MYDKEVERNDEKGKTYYDQTWWFNQKWATRFFDNWSMLGSK